MWTTSALSVWALATGISGRLIISAQVHKSRAGARPLLTDVGGRTATAPVKSLTPPLLPSSSSPTPNRMSMFDRIKQGAQKASRQATLLAQQGSSKIASESAQFVHGFSLPGEADKAAKILASFLGKQSNRLSGRNAAHSGAANPEHPESALNSIPKAVLQRARGKLPLLGPHQRQIPTHSPL